MPLAAFPKCFLDALVVHKTMTPHEWIDLAADELDIDGLELYGGFLPADDADALNRLREHAAQRGLALPMLCVSPDFTQPDKTARQAEIARQEKWIRVTAQLGGTICRVLSGQRRPDVAINDGVRWAAECITACLPTAKAHGVTLVLENHYKDGYWDYPELAQKRDVFLQLLDAIPPSPFFGVNFDPSNAVIAGEDPLVLLDAVKERVVSCHASDRFFAGGTADDLRKQELDPQKGYAAILRHGVVGQGLNDYDAIFARLQSVQFKGWISIEDGDDPDLGIGHLRQSAVFLREKMAQRNVG